MPEPFVIKPLAAVQIDTAAKTLAACFQEAFATLLTPAALAALSVERARARLCDADAVSLIATAEERMVGISQIKDGWITLLYVRQSHQGQGVGSALLRRLMEIARGTGRDRLRLWCLHDNWRARRFYEHHGATTGVSDIMTVGGQPLLHLEYQFKI